VQRVSWKDPFEGIGVLPIVASPAFVGLQILKDQEIASARLGSETSELGSTNYLMMADPDVASVFSKVLRQPDELTADEMVQMNSLLAALRSYSFGIATWSTGACL
jgi:hypothetical protein